MKKTICLIIILFSIYVTNPLSAEWVDGDGAGQESIDCYVSGGPSGGGSVCLDTAGKPHISWQEGTEIYYLKWNGIAWVDADGTGQGEINISNNGGISNQLSFRLDNSDNPHVAWIDDTPGTREVFYLKWNGSAWVDADGVGQGQANVTNNGNGSASPSLGLDNSGNPHIAWVDDFSGTTEIHYLKWDGASWIDIDGAGPEDSQVSNTVLTNSSCLCLDNLNYPHISWVGGGNNIYYIKWDGSAWVDADGTGQGDVNVSNTGQPSGMPSLRLDSSYNPHIAWEESTGTDDEIRYLKWNGNSWVDADGTAQESISIYSTSDEYSRPSLYLTSSDEPCIAWEIRDASFEYYLYYQQWDGSSWVDADGSGQDDIIVYDFPSTSGVDPSLNVDSSGNPHIAWTGPFYLKWDLLESTPTVTPTPIPEGVILVYPNPFNSDKAFGGTLKFKGLPERSRVEIYTISLELVKELKEETGEASWDGRNEAGSLVAAGTYCYLVKKDKEILKRGKILVRR